MATGSKKVDEAPVDWAAVIGMSPVTRVGPLVTVSGTGPLGADGRAVALGDAGAQARRCLERIAERLETVGADLAAVVSTRVYIASRADWEPVGRAHGEVFGDSRPASTMICAELVDPDFLVEIEATAWIADEAGRPERPRAS